MGFILPDFWEGFLIGAVMFGAPLWSIIIVSKGKFKIVFTGKTKGENSRE